jgi:N-acetylneuraminic acid mutarotase
MFCCHSQKIHIDRFFFFVCKCFVQSARSGHTVTRAGQVLFLFGGENSKGKKLNDLHMFDLKSSTWLPLRYK